MFQLLDLILAAIMIISGLLALMRGFTREVLSLIAWGLAALAAFFALRSPEILDLFKKYVIAEPEIAAKIALAGGVFVVVLIVVSLISVKLSDMVVDSAAGMFDRTLGFFYGLARGLVLVAIAYLFYGWLMPPDRQEDWVKNARSLPLLKEVGATILSFVPPDIAETLNNTALGNSSTQPQPKTDTQAGDGAAPQPGEEGYKSGETQGLDNLIQGTQGGQAQPKQGEQPALGDQSNPD
jgi:membrane protein required for colicin V production